MFVPIKIDLDELVEEFDLNFNQIKLLGIELTNRITDKYFSAIKQKVNTTLKSTRGIYLKNISIETVDDLTKEIILSGWLPNAIESGVDTFDMKPGFSKAKNVKISLKGNWYTTIPFIWSDNTLPKNISQIVDKNNGKSLKEYQIPESQRLHKVKDLLKGINSNIIGTYQHKSSIYTGISKSESNGKISFRRVGAVSDKNSFWHPGLVKKDFFNIALDEIQNEIPILADKIIDQFLENEGY